MTYNVSSVTLNSTIPYLSNVTVVMKLTEQVDGGTGIIGQGHGGITLQCDMGKLRGAWLFTIQCIAKCGVSRRPVFSTVVVAAVIDSWYN